MKKSGTFFAAILMVVMAASASQAEAKDLNPKTAREALSQAGKLRLEKAKKREKAAPAKVLSLSANSMPTVAPDGTPMPKWPECDSYLFELTAENNVRYGDDCYTNFVSPNPIRYFVNDVRTTNDAAQQHTPEANPGSRYGLEGYSVAESHVLLTLPGEIGEHTIEREVDWHKDYPGLFFPVKNTVTIEPLGAIWDMCVGGDTVTLTLLLDVFNGKLTNPQYEMNGVKIDPVGVKYGSDSGFEGLIIVVELTMWLETYREIFDRGGGYAQVVVSGDPGEVRVEFEGFLFYPEDLPPCGEFGGTGSGRGRGRG